jgi:hypothetical protein
VGGAGSGSILLTQSVNAAFFTVASHWICRIEQVRWNGNTSGLYSASSRLDFRPGHRLFCRSCFSPFFSVALPAHSGPWPLIQFRNHFSQTVGLLGRVIIPSQSLYLNTGQHKHTPNIHVLSGIRTHDPSVRTSEDSSCLRPRGYCDRLVLSLSPDKYQ